MDQELLTWIARFSYPAVALLLAATGVGAPLSEDLILLTGGLVVGKGGGNLYLMILTGYAGVVFADSLLYRVGRRLGPRALESKRLKRLLTPARVEWVQGHFRRHGALTIVIARVVPGLRATTFLIAGLSGMRMRKFFLADAGAAAFTVPLLVYLGYRFGTSVLHDVEVVGKFLLVGLVFAVLGIFLVKRVRTRRLKTGLADAASRMAVQGQKK